MAPRVLILTPVKDAERYLDRYVENIEQLDNPQPSLSIGLLESDSSDQTPAELHRLLGRLEAKCHRVTVVKKDFGFKFPPNVPRWTPALQLWRRTILARARNHLLFRALQDEDWVLWLDVDVISYPRDLIRQLLTFGRDILHPHCVLCPGGTTFDRNGWSDQGRKLLQDFRGTSEPVALDAVGASVLLVRGDRHRDGLIFPTFPYGRENAAMRPLHPLWARGGEIESEGFGLLAQDMGYQCWGLPDLEVVHAPDPVPTISALPTKSSRGNPRSPDHPLPAAQLLSDDIVPAVSRRPARRSSEIAAEPARNFWEALASRFGQTTELDIHIHAEEERGHLFHAIDSRTTELEVLNFINALVCLFKPEAALETGSFLGFGSCAIASALKSNRRGHLISLEIDESFLTGARERLRQFDPSLEALVTFVKQSSLDFIDRYQGAPFDFVFIDTELEIRMSELSLLQKRELLAPGAVCLVHDTSPYRLPETGGGGADDFRDRQVLSALGNQFEILQFPYSRGFHLLRHRGRRTSSSS